MFEHICSCTHLHRVRRDICGSVIIVIVIHIVIHIIIVIVIATMRRPFAEAKAVLFEQMQMQSSALHTHRVSRDIGGRQPVFLYCS